MTGPTVSVLRPISRRVWGTPARVPTVARVFRQPGRVRDAVMCVFHERTLRMHTQADHTDT